MDSLENRGDSMAKHGNLEIQNNADVSIQHKELAAPAALLSEADPLSVATSERVCGETLPASNANSFLLLDAELKIHNVTTFHQTLCRLLKQIDKIELDASQVISVDTANLQMLVVCRLNALKCGKEVIIAFPSETFIEAAELLGLSEMLGIEKMTASLF